MRSITGKVIAGKRLGHRIGFPTANLRLDGVEDIIDGVWKAEAVVGGIEYRAIANVGRNPTVEENGERLLEVHILNFDRDIYGQEITVRLLDRIRPELHFASVEELREQIKKDIEKI